MVLFCDTKEKEHIELEYAVCDLQNQIMNTFVEDSALSVLTGYIFTISNMSSESRMECGVVSIDCVCSATWYAIANQAQTSLILIRVGDFWNMGVK